MRKHEHLFEFKPTHKLWLACNYRPRISVNDPAMLRRIKLCPFLYVVPEAKRDAKLGAKLRAEKSGILNWMLAGLKRWQAGQGLADDDKTPAIMRAAKTSYVAENDTIGEFLDDTTEECAGAKLDKQVLYSAYCQWCKYHGHSHPYLGRNLSTMLSARGWNDLKSNGQRYWLNVTLRPDAQAEALSALLTKPTPQPAPQPKAEAPQGAEPQAVAPDSAKPTLRDRIAIAKQAAVAAGLSKGGR
jgi:phage/plasmid-associated DNA primase